MTRSAADRSRTLTLTATTTTATTATPAALATFTAILSRRFAALAERRSFALELVAALVTFAVTGFEFRVHFFVVHGFLDARRGVMASAASAAAASRMALPASTLASTAAFFAATAVLAQHFAEAVGAHFADDQELGRNRIRQEQRAAIVEVDALFPRVPGANRDHDVVVRGATTGFDRVLGSEREVQEAAPTGAQPVTASAIRIAARNTDEQLGGRLRGFAGLDLDRVSVQRADLRAFDLVALAITAEHGVAHVHLVDGLTEALVQRAHDVVDLRVTEFVDLEVEFLRLVTEHVGERAGDAFDQSGMRHGAQKPADCARSCSKKSARAYRALRPQILSRR